MEAASSTCAHSVEDPRASGADFEAALPLLPSPPPPPPLSSASTSSVSRSPVPSHESPHASSSSYLGRQMECWICFDTATSRANPIVTHRCRCRGSVGFVHQKCIDRWVIQQQNRACRSCGATYRLVHTDYPPDANLPLDPESRLAFLFQFLVKPLFWEVAETYLCVLLRFVYVPQFLGTLYNYHRSILLLRTLRHTVWFPFLIDPLSTNRVESPLVLWLLNINVEAEAIREMSWSVCLSLWADTLLFGLVVCTVMNAIRVASRKWNRYFKNARRQHEVEVARQAQTAAAMAATAGAAPTGTLRGTAPAEANAGADASPQGVNAGVVAAAAAQPFFEEPTVEGGRPGWGPVPVDTDVEPDAATDAHGGGGVDEVDDDENDWVDNDATSSSDDSSLDSSSDGEDEMGGAGGDDDDANGADGSPTRLSFVDEVFDMVDWVKRSAGGGGLRRLFPSLVTQLRYGTVLALFLRCPLGRMVLSVVCLVAVAGWRLRYARNVLETPRRRFDEVARRVPLLSPEAVRTLFYVYLVDAFFFYGVFPEMGGIMLHYALSPYLDIGMHGGLLDFFYGLTVWRLVVYWAVGALLVMLLTAMELTVVSALFANGVELFFVRSFDARWDSVLGYWRCVITQVFDADPPRIIYGFARVAVVELLVLLVFVRLPFWGMFAVRDAVWGDGTRSVQRPLASSALPAAEPTKLSLSLGFPRVHDADQDFTFTEWRRAEALQLLDEKVLMPFGEFYAEMIGSHPSFLEGHNMTAPIRMDPLVAAAVLVTTATPAQMWAEVWGNLSDNAVFTLDLLDPAAATKVAELSEGFRETLARVRAPLEWLRQATLRGSICDTLTALSSPADFSRPHQHDADAPQRLPAVDLESLLRPPNTVLPHPNATAARNRQMIFEAWQQAHYNVMQHIRFVARSDFGAGGVGVEQDKLSTLGGVPDGTVRRASRAHTVNIVNCYVTLLQVTQPFVRMGRWHTAVLEWWSMLLLRFPVVNYGMIISAYIYAFCVAVACFAVFPLQRAQLRLLLPYVQWIGRRVVHMEDYLFDPEQVRAVEEFVHAEVEDELGLPPMMEPLGFNRREDYIDESRVPRYVVLRRVVVSVLFFAAASLMVWTVPVLCGSLLLSLTCNALPLLLGTTLLSFFVWSPSLLARAALFGGALFLAIIFAGPLFFAVYVVPFLQAYWKSIPTLVEETFERHYDIHQMVGPHSDGDEGDGEGSEWETNSSSGWGGSEAAADDRDEWESVESSDSEAVEGNDVAPMVPELPPPGDAHGGEPLEHTVE